MGQQSLPPSVVNDMELILNFPTPSPVCGLRGLNWVYVGCAVGSCKVDRRFTDVPGLIASCAEASRGLMKVLESFIQC